MTILTLGKKPLCLNTVALRTHITNLLCHLGRLSNAVILCVNLFTTECNLGHKDSIDEAIAIGIATRFRQKVELEFRKVPSTLSENLSKWRRPLKKVKQLKWPSK